jgi:hypothetical protein
MSLETGVPISTPDSCGVLARNMIRLPFDGGYKDRPARTKIDIDALSDAPTLAGIRNVRLFLYAGKANQPQYDTNHVIPFVLLSFQRYHLIKL